ncbi:MAG TPA: sigma-70 family RNA polymerase sigma factor [Polyangiaceae bacterium]
MSKACLSVSPVSSLESIAIVPELPESGVFPAEPSTQVRLSLVPRPAPMLTLPPPVRAAKMLKSVRTMAAGIARRLPRHVEVEDLVGAGALGLADAFSRRNGMPGTEFEAFASVRVRGAMFDELRRLDSMPRRVRARAKEVAQAKRRVEQRDGANAAEESVAKELGMDMAAYQNVRTTIEARRAPIQLSALTEDGVEAPIPETAEGPDATVARAQIGKLIASGVHELPERMRRVVVGLYVEGETLKQIGQSLGVSESRVCQIHGDALALLRARFADEQAETTAPVKRATPKKRTRRA